MSSHSPASLRIESRSLRTSPNYELVLFDRLSAVEQSLYRTLRADEAFYGIVKPRDNSQGTAKLSVSRDVALLLFTLQQPGPLPSYVRESADTNIERTVAQLILDGIVEVESANGWVSGAAALSASDTTVSSVGRIAGLSRAAIEHAAALDSADPGDLQERLYRSNHVPVSPAWSERLPNAGAVRAYLRLNAEPLAPLIGKYWQSSASGTAWMYWNAKQSPPRRADGAMYKLYISPTLDTLPQTFAAAAEVLSTAPCIAFKLGMGAHGVARPDKMVAYFRAKEPTLECGELVAQRAEGASAQGVPFTAEIGSDGLTSWGIDPPASNGATATSWRQWVCRRLAQYIFAAQRADDGGVSPAHFALERLRLDGVDTTSWTPDLRRVAQIGSSEGGEA